MGRRFDEATLLRVADALRTRIRMVETTATTPDLEPLKAARLDDVQRREAARGPDVRSRTDDRGAPSSNRASPSSTPSSTDAASGSVRTIGCPTSGFTPDGVPGIAIPFYLAHRAWPGSNAPRCSKSKAAIRVVPPHPAPRGGGTRSTTPTSCSAVRRGGRLFWRSEKRSIPSITRRQPYSKSFVQHLDHWYAQSHPDEDFAETFAVLDGPAVDVGDALRRLPAQRKLEYMTG